MRNQYNINRFVLSAAICLMTGMAVLAQGVRGRVTDTNTNSAIPGATIVVVNTAIGATSDANGGYSIKLNPGSYTLRVSFVGYGTKSVPVTVTGSEAVTVDVTLQEGPASLSEVIVVGSRSTQARTSTETVAPIDVIQSRDLVATGQTDITQ